jgi:hypothetical protein
LAYFEINPAIAVTSDQFVFLYELRRNVRDFDPDIFRIRHWSVQIEVFDINAAKACTLARENTVEENLDKLKRGRVGADVTRIADFAAANGDPGTIRIVLLWSDFTYDESMADLLSLMYWDVIILDHEEGVRTIDAFRAGLGSGADALTKSAKFIRVRCIPGCFIPWVTAELPMFEEFA